MTIANSFASKASVAFVAVAMALSMVAPAQAQTAEELQAQIDTLMATIASLQAGASATPSANAYVFTRSLTIGSEGADVTALQTYLIGAGFSIPAGATGYFGAQTQAAVAAWQTANGVMPAAGYFGPVSQAKYNALMAATPSTPTTPDDEDEDEDEDTDNSALQGEASLGDVDLKEGEDTDIEEGQEAAPVAEFEVQFDNGDAEISRLDITLVAQGSEEDAWDTFEEVSLWVDGDEVATVDASDEDNYLDEDDGSLRFSGLDIVSREDEDTTITIAVTVQGSVDDLAATWDVDVTEIRFVDADDVTSTEDVTVDESDFTIDVEGADDELIIKSSPEDLEATTLAVDEDSSSDMMTIFSFDLDSDDSSNDLELNNIIVGLQTSDSAITDVINDAMLVIDGEEFDDFDWSDDAGAEGEIDFNLDGDYTIEAGERVTVEVQVEFKKLTGNYAEGTTISATSSNASGDYDVEGADDVVPTGSAVGEDHTLRSAGIILEGGETETETQGTNDTTGIYTIEFEVTALEGDFYINDLASTTAAAGNGGVEFRVEGPATPTTATGVLSSTADDDTNAFLVREGETETFTLTVTVDAATTGQHRVVLEEVWFSATDTGLGGSVQVPNPEADYRTEYENINAS